MGVAQKLYLALQEISSLEFLVIVQQASLLSLSLCALPVIFLSTGFFCSFKFKQVAF
jgi:hypothetical protein